MQAASSRCVSVKSVNIVLTIQVEPQAFTVAQQSHWGGTFNKLMSNIRSVSLPTFNHRFSWSIVYQVSKFVKHARILFSEAYMYCINKQTNRWVKKYLTFDAHIRKLIFLVWQD